MGESAQERNSEFGIGEPSTSLVVARKPLC